MTDQGPAEPIIEPELPIVDAHHHLWFLPVAALATIEAREHLLSHPVAPTFRHHACYLFDEFMADVKSGHNVRASVYVEGYSMYRASGPDAMKSVGEIEFANGIAVMAASGAFGEMKTCAAIVGASILDLAMPWKRF